MVAITTYAIIGILWMLSDKITKKLSKGKSFAPNETKFYGHGRK